MCGRIQLSNEYAEVELVLDASGNGPRVRIHDLRTGRAIWLDALALSGLAGLNAADLAFLLDPARRESPG